MASAFGYLQHHDILLLLADELTDNSDLFYLAILCRSTWVHLSPRLYASLAAVRDVGDGKRNSMLHVVASKGLTAVTKRLLELGCDVNERNAENYTPLHLAAEILEPTRIYQRPRSRSNPTRLDRAYRMVELLLSKGADISAVNREGFTALHIAAHEGHVQTLSLLIASGAKIEAAATDNGYTPLHVAVLAGQAEVISALLSSGAEIEARASSRETPLHLAPDTTIAGLLLQNGADPGAQTDDYETPLHLAAKNGRCDMAALLIKQGVNVDAKTDSLATPLHHAAKYGHAHMARLLVESGASVDAKNGGSQTPLHLAAVGSHDEVIEYLVSSTECAVNVLNSDHETALSIAIAESPPPLRGIAKLLEYRADITLGGPLLHAAIDAGNWIAADLLLAAGADPNAPNKTSGRTPLLEAVNKNQYPTIRALISAGADLNIPTWTPLHEAARFASHVVAKVLLDAGAKADAVYIPSPRDGRPAVSDEYRGWTPLHDAAMHNNKGVISLLLSQGADVNARCHDAKASPLILAAQHGHLASVELLLNEGHANPNIHCNGMSPLRATASHKVVPPVGKMPAEEMKDQRAGIAKLLIQKGAMVDAQANGWTALHQAAKMGLKDVVECLLEHGADPGVRAFAGTGKTPWQATPRDEDEVRLLLSRAERARGYPRRGLQNRKRESLVAVKARRAEPRQVIVVAGGEGQTTTVEDSASGGDLQLRGADEEETEGEDGETADSRHLDTRSTIPQGEESNSDIDPEPGSDPDANPELDPTSPTSSSQSILSRDSSIPDLNTDERPAPPIPSTPSAPTPAASNDLFVNTTASPASSPTSPTNATGSPKPPKDPTPSFEKVWKATFAEFVL